MKKLTAIVLAALLLTGCGSASAPESFVQTAEPTAVTSATEPILEDTAEIPYQTRFDTVTEIILSDEGIRTDSDAVSVTNDIIYYYVYFRRCTSS